MDEKGQYLASCDDSGEICCVELSRAKCVSKVTPHDNICASVQWVPSRSAEVSMDPARTLFVRHLVQWLFWELFSGYTEQCTYLRLRLDVLTQFTEQVIRVFASRNG